MNSDISDKDKNDWENFLSGKEKLPNKDIKFLRKNKSLSKTIDLHGYSLDEANKQINNLINDCYESGICKLKIVTGKGLHSQNEKNPYVSKDLGILRYSVPEYIKNNQALMKLISKIEEAGIEDGGSGAFFIHIKKKLQNKF